MTVLDTDVVSETMKNSPAAAVMQWRKAYANETLFVTAITQAEILYGIELLAKGRRRAGLEEAAKAVFAVDFEGRILPFDGQAAEEFAKIAAARRKLGRPISHADAQIAAIARLARRGACHAQHFGLRTLRGAGDKPLGMTRAPQTCQLAH